MSKIQKSRKDYAGTEQSPYWEYLSKRGDLKQENDANEPPEANPDVLSEDKGLYYVDRTSVLMSDKFEHFQKIWPKLTKLQKVVIVMLGYEGKTQKEVAKILGVQPQSISQTLKAIRRKYFKNAKNL